MIEELVLESGRYRLIEYNGKVYGINYSDENIMRMYMRKAERLQEICEFIETVMKAKAKKEPQSTAMLGGK